LNYISASQYWKEKFGGKVYKLSLSSGCTCPNRDGKVSIGGCTFCSEGGSGDFAAPFLPIKEQIDQAKRLVDHKFPKGEQHRYLAYFQSFTNTYGDPVRLERLYRETLEEEEIVGISIGTRPDCLGPEMLATLNRLNQIKPVSVELGLQTIHDKTARRINRGYGLLVFEKAYGDLIGAGLEVLVHVILGLPGETKEDMLETVRYLSALSPTLPGIKLQLMHVLKGTRLAEEYASEPFPILGMEEYVDLIVNCLRILPPATVIHRLTGDGPKRLLLAPMWSADKKRVMNLIRKKVEEA
jgi:radical SAM protein (TIGR01212 family)